MNRPLAGQCVLVTRDYSQDYDALKDNGAEIFEFATIAIAPADDYTELDSAIDALDNFNWLVFSSINGFSYFHKRLTAKGKGIKDLAALKICAIGPRTAQTIRDAGLEVNLMPEDYNADGLIIAFIKEAKKIQDPRYNVSNLGGMRMLMPVADNAREVFPERVIELDGEISCPVAYRSVMPEKDASALAAALKSGKINMATFTSAATFTNLLSMLGAGATDMLSRVTIAAIGPVTKKAIEAAGLTVSIMPKKATISAMVEAILAARE